MKKKWSTGKIVGLIFGIIGAILLLVVAFYISLILIFVKLYELDADSIRDFIEDEYDYDWYDDDDYDDDDNYDYDDDNYDDYDNELNDEEDDEYYGDMDYYEFHDEIRTDLSYQISNDYYESKAADNENAMISAEYPVVEGLDAKMLTKVNDAIQKEIEMATEHVNSMSSLLEEDMTFEFLMESYVTYMDEDILSIAYKEYGYIDDEIYESYVVSLNIDMESGMEMTNSQILKIDDAFSVDFRERCERQNGEIDMLNYYSDQDITEMMNDNDYLIIFYTPLGMEVGFNYYYGWVTVTYSDYEDYQKSF